MEWLSSLLLVFLFCVSYIFLTYKRMMKERSALPPGPHPLPIIGNFLQIDTKNFIKSLMTLRDKYGPVYTLYLGPRPGVVICGYDAVKEALVDHSETFGARGHYPVFENFIGLHDVAFTNGERWRALRRFMMVTLRNFGMGKKSLEIRIQEEADFLIKELESLKGAPINPKSILSEAVFNVICSVIYGKRFDYGDKELRNITDHINTIFLILSGVWGRLYNAYAPVMDYLPGRHQEMGRRFQALYDIIDREIQSHERTLDPAGPRDFIDCFLIKMKEEQDDGGSAFYRTSLARSVQNLMFGGTETVSSTLRYGFLVLLKHPEVMERMQREIDAVIGRNRLPSLSDRKEMPYTEATISEVQRFCDVLPANLPHCTTSEVSFRGFTIPKGTFVTLPLYSVHNDTNYYPEPRSFNPNNFLDEKGLHKKVDAHMPFSVGKRICPGETLACMELFLFFTSLLQTFRFEPVIPREELDLEPRECGFGNVAQEYEIRAIPRS